MKYFCLLIVVFLFTCGCTNENKVNYEKFDTRKMLSDITYQLIMPSIEKLNISSNNLNIAVVDYVNSPSEEKIIVIQDLWKNCASNYATVYAFNIGDARKKFFHYKLYNWPSLSIAIENLIKTPNRISKNYVSNLSSQAKTLSGIEYLLFNDNISTINKGFVKSEKRMNYLKWVVFFHKERTKELLNLWSKSGENYAEKFINKEGNSINSSINKLYNGVHNVISTAKISKIGKSAGLEKSENINLDELQAKYSGYSKELLIENLEISKKIFFNNNGLGLSNYIKEITGDEKLNTLFKIKIEATLENLYNLKNSLAITIKKNPKELITIHNQLQELIILLTVDIRSSLSIVITRTDNDGD
jgi:hypothetical protein